MIIGHIGGGAVGGYEIEKSLRLRAAAGAFLSRTPGAAGNRKTWTWSGWVKRGLFSAAQLFSTPYTSAGTTSTYLGFAGDALVTASLTSGATNWSLSLAAVFRDPSAWYHIVCVCDTTNAIAGDRVRVFVNGLRLTSFTVATYPPQNTDSHINNTVLHSTGRLNLDGGTSQLLDGYLSEINFIDGQALTPSSFGEFNADGVWVPKKYTGTYGNNGFYLPFNDGTNLTELCRDRSGNGNDWTANNISLTAGATYDWVDDTPTEVFPTFNALRPGITSYSAATLSNGNLAISGTSRISFGSMEIPQTGKWAFKFSTPASGTIDAIFGVATTDMTVVNASPGIIGAMHSGSKYVNGTQTGGYIATIGTNDTVEVLVDNGAVTIRRNGVANSVAGTMTTGKTYVPMVLCGASNTMTFGADYGQQGYTPPTGFKALCTKNRPSVTITDPRQHHTVITVTKSGDTNFTLPWDATDFDTLFWIKRRDASGDWYQIDGLRGYDKILKSNSTAAETTDANVLGVSGTTCTLKSTLPNGTYVIYAWKAGRVTERQTNTSGTITSTVSRNVTTGFSIVTYTGTGANATVGHGLGVAPRMVVVKSRGPAARAWGVYHASIGNTGALFLNLTDATNTAAFHWNNTSPTSTVFSIGPGTVANSTENIVAYCHAEIPGYSKFGSYTGNGSTDGPFVWGDVSVMDVLIKSSSLGEGWVLFDTERNPFNVMNRHVYPHLSLAEQVSAGNITDALSSGFKLRGSDTALNGNTSTYIYAAYARHPFGAENVSPATAR